MANDVITIPELVYSVRNDFEAVLVDQNMRFDTEAEFAIQHIMKSDYNQSLAMRNRDAVKDAIRNVAGMGLTLNPALKLAYLAPRDNKLQLLISYMGLVNVAVASGAIRMAKAEIVYANDLFKLNALDELPTHEFSPFSAPGSRGEEVGVYVCAKTAHGDWITDWMTVEQVNDVRARSDSWKGHVGPKKTKTPWATDREEMVKKTIIRRGYKMWPVNPRLAHVIDHLNKTEGDSTITEGEKPAFNITEALSQIDRAQTLEQLKLARQHWQKVASDNNDRASYDRVTAASKTRREQLGNGGDVTDVVPK